MGFGGGGQVVWVFLGGRGSCGGWGEWQGFPSTRTALQTCADVFWIGLTHF